MTHKWHDRSLLFIFFSYFLPDGLQSDNYMLLNPTGGNLQLLCHLLIALAVEITLLKHETGLGTKRVHGGVYVLHPFVILIKSDVFLMLDNMLEEVGILFVYCLAPYVVKTPVAHKRN